jgi:hypothetical protein
VQGSSNLHSKENFAYALCLSAKNLVPCLAAQDDEGYISASAFAAYLGMRSNMQTMVRSSYLPHQLCVAWSEEKSTVHPSYLFWHAALSVAAPEHLSPMLPSVRPHVCFVAWYMQRLQLGAFDEADNGLLSTYQLEEFLR